MKNKTEKSPYATLSQDIIRAHKAKNKNEPKASKVSSELDIRGRKVK